MICQRRQKSEKPTAAYGKRKLSGMANPMHIATPMAMVEYPAKSQKICPLKASVHLELYIKQGARRANQHERVAFAVVDAPPLLRPLPVAVPVAGRDSERAPMPFPRAGQQQGHRDRDQPDTAPGSLGDVAHGYRLGHARPVSGSLAHEPRARRRGFSVALKTGNR